MIAITSERLIDIIGMRRTSPGRFSNVSIHAPRAGGDCLNRNSLKTQEMDMRNRGPSKIGLILVAALSLVNCKVFKIRRLYFARTYLAFAVNRRFAD